MWPDLQQMSAATEAGSVPRKVLGVPWGWQGADGEGTGCAGWIRGYSFALCIRASTRSATAIPTGTATAALPTTVRQLVLVS